MRIIIARESDVPLYRQVVEWFRTRIRDGALAPGTRLPTIRQLAQDLHLTRLTVQTAYAELQAQGLIESVVGRGTFVATARPPHLAAIPPRPHVPTSWQTHDLLSEAALSEQPRLLSFSHAAPASEAYPLRELRRAYAVALATADVFDYGPTTGEAPLREQMSRLLLDRGVATPTEQVLITSGAQQAIALALQALSRPSDVILAEAPTYPRFVELVAQRGQQLIGIPRDEHGLSLSALEAACVAYRPRLLYLVPTFHNPTGTCLGAEQRGAVLRLAATYGVLIVEDDIYGFLAHDGPAPPPLKAADDGEHVIYLTSLSKALAPGLRLGALVASPQYLPDLAAVKQGMDLVSSPVAQRALADYLRRGAFSSHLQRVRPLYRERRDVLLAALARFLPACTWTRPEGGLSVWVTLPEGINERDFFLDALEHGVGVTRGQAFFAQPQSQASVRLCFGALSPTEIEHGVRMLGEVLDAHLHRRARPLARATLTSSPLV